MTAAAVKAMVKGFSQAIAKATTTEEIENIQAELTLAIEALQKLEAKAESKAWGIEAEEEEARAADERAIEEEMHDENERGAEKVLEYKTRRKREKGYEFCIHQVKRCTYAYVETEAPNTHLEQMSWEVKQSETNFYYYIELSKKRTDEAISKIEFFLSSEN